MPASAIGLTTGFASAEESVYGTAVAPDRAYEILSESLERRQNVIVSNGLRAQTINFRRGARRGLTTRHAEGTVSMEVPHVGFGRILKHALGGTPTITQAAVGPPSAWEQVHQFGSTAGKSLTLQKQLRDSTNTLVQQLTFVGSKVRSFGVSISGQNLLQAEIGFLCRDVNKTTAAAALTYPATIKTFNFTQGLLKVAGATIAKVTDASATLERTLKDDGFYLGSGGMFDEPYENDWPTATGELTAEFDNIATFYDRFAADSAAELILEFRGALITGSYNELFRVTIPDIRFTGPTPTVGGPEVVTQSAPFEAQYDGTNPGMKVEYMSTDSAI